MNEERKLSLLRIRRMVVKEIRQLLRDPMSKRMIFGAPIIQLLLFGYAVNTDVRNVSTFLVDHDRTSESRRLVDAFTASGYFRVIGRSDDPRALASALDHGDAKVGLEIPVGYAADLAAGRGAAVQLVVDGANSNTATVAAGYAAKIAQELGTRVAARSGTPVPGGVELHSRAWFNPSLESRVYNVPAVIGVIVLLMCLLLTALAVVRERELGTLDQLRVSPLTPAELILSKTIPVALVGLVDMGLITIVARLWFDVPFRGGPLDLLPAAILYILAGLAVGLLISTWSRTQQEAFMTMFLFLLPAIILSGFFYPISSMPTGFRWMTLLNPVRHFLEVVRAVFLKGEGVAGLWTQHLALAAIAAGAMTVAVRRFARSNAD
jgi:ABC-2 type transport system permease protein